MNQTINKWDFKTRTYSPHTIPQGAFVVLYSEDMDMFVNCASCLEIIKYGNSFTSRTLHTDHGLGFPVCEKCYLQERQEERETK